MPPIFIYSRPLRFSRLVQELPRYPTAMNWVKPPSAVQQFQTTAILRANRILAKRIHLVVKIAHIFQINIPDSNNPLKATWNLLCRWMTANYPTLYENPTLIFDTMAIIIGLQRNVDQEKFKLHADLIDFWDDLREQLIPILDIPELTIDSLSERAVSAYVNNLA